MSPLRIRITAIFTFLFLFFTSSLLCEIIVSFHESLMGPIILAWTVINAFWLLRTLKILRNPTTVEKKEEEIDTIL